jgi:hypothetical protein
LSYSFEERYGMPSSYKGLRKNAALERDAKKAARAKSRRLTTRLIQDGERRYAAYSLDELIEIDSEMDAGRPGLPHA